MLSVLVGIRRGRLDETIRRNVQMKNLIMKDGPNVIARETNRSVFVFVYRIKLAMCCRFSENR